MRNVGENITQWACGRYFYCWCGEEILMASTNDADAIVEGANLLEELETE